METRTIQLLSGPECEFKRFSTEDQALLFPITEKNANMPKNINKVLQSVVVRIGSDEDITRDKIEAMLSADRRWLLLHTGLYTAEYTKAMLKLLSSDLEEDFELEVELPEAEIDPINQTLKIPLKFSHTFREDPKKDLVLFNEVFELKFQPYPFQNECREYSDVLQRVEFEVRLLKKKIRGRLPDGRIETLYAGVKESEVNMNLALKMCQPKWIEKRESENRKGEKEIKEICVSAVEVDKLEPYESAKFREVFNRMNGSVFTHTTIQHPENAQFIDIIDILRTPEFFFPNTDPSPSE